MAKTEYDQVVLSKESLMEQFHQNRSTGASAVAIGAAVVAVALLALGMMNRDALWICVLLSGSCVVGCVFALWVKQREEEENRASLEAIRDGQMFFVKNRVRSLSSKRRPRKRMPSDPSRTAVEQGFPRRIAHDAQDAAGLCEREIHRFSRPRGHGHADGGAPAGAGVFPEHRSAAGDIDKRRQATAGCVLFQKHEAKPIGPEPGAEGAYGLLRQSPLLFQGKEV